MSISATLPPTMPSHMAWSRRRLLAAFGAAVALPTAAQRGRVRPDLSEPGRSNGDEQRIPRFGAMFSKGLAQGADGLVDAAAYRALVDALGARGDKARAALDRVPLGGQRKLENPLASLADPLIGPPAASYGLAPAPRFDSNEQAAELIELAWFALLRDIPFAQWDQDPLVAAACAELSQHPGFRGPRDAAGKVTPATLGRGPSPGELHGPMVSQLLLRDLALRPLKVEQRFRSLAAGADHVADLPAWRELMRGAIPGPNQLGPEPRYPHSGRDLAEACRRDLGLPRPLVATVTDLGHNRLGGVPVRFEVVKGAGLFPATGLGTAVIETDSDGRAIVEVSLDPEKGPASTVVRATIPELEPSPFATFVGSGLAAGDPADTAISGVVLDGTGLPVEGVTARVRGTSLSATTDEAGLFRLHPAPVGTVYLDIDGSTANRPGTWPDLEYVVTTVPGREVDVGTPIHLLPLELGSGVFVDESTGGSIELSEIPGFRLDIAPGSVTFPGGGRSGLVSATAVHHDRIPMTPNFGQQPRLILTIQPAGARFDPPARLTLPNVENLTPGEVTEMYSFDHDLGHFVSIGPASVSRDGLVIVADEGVGIVKAGWHCGGSPARGGATHDCPEGYFCDGSTCRRSCPPSGPGGGCPKCRVNCSCDDPGQEITISPIQSQCVASPGSSVSFSVTSNGGSKLRWDAPGFAPRTGMGTTFTGVLEAEGSTDVTVACPGGRRQSKRIKVLEACDEIEVEVSNDLRYTQNPSTDPLNKASIITRLNNFTLAPCADSSMACFAMDQLHLTTELNITPTRPDTQRDITTNPESWAITASTCAQFLGDLTPIPTDYFKPPNATLCPAPVLQRPNYKGRPYMRFLDETNVHEVTHWDQQFDSQTGVVPRMVEAIKALIESVDSCGECEGRPPDLAELVGEAAREARDAWRQWHNERTCANEAAAYQAAEDFALAPLRQAVRTWVGQNHPDWPQECR